MADSIVILPQIAVQPSPRHGELPSLVVLLVSLALAACLVYTPWEAISGSGFPDLYNYLTAIDILKQNGAKLFDFSNADLLALVLNEYLWREILIFVGTYFEDTLRGFLLVSLFTATLTIYHVIRRAGIGYALLFLLSPLTIDLFISQTRSALALAVFLSALSLRSRFGRYLLFATALFLHSFGAVLIVASLFNSVVLARNEIGTRTKFALLLLFALVGSVVWAFLAQYLLGAVGDRRASQDPILPASIPFTVWWILLMCMLMAFARLQTPHANGEYVMMAVFLLSMFVFSTLLRAGALRFLSLSLPLVFIAIRSMRDPAYRLAATVGTLCFNFVLFAFYWVS